DGRLVDVQVEYAYKSDHHGLATGLISILTDITERKKAEMALFEYQKQLRALTADLALAEERERRRIATNLHDRVSQKLAVAKMKLGALEASAGPGDLSTQIRTVRDLVGQAIGESRSLTLELSPPILYELGFEAAVDWLSEKVRQEHGLPVEVYHHRFGHPLQEDVQVLLFRGVDELLHNVVKHARARTALVAIEPEDDLVRVTVSDDGDGFDLARPDSSSDQNRGFGLFNLKERLEHIKGSLHIDSNPGRGTRVVMTVPLDQEAVQGYGRPD
ncbi:MAG: sensor histidine kinase, partial [Thermodesulfobacteriota bacterium]